MTTRHGLTAVFFDPPYTKAPWTGAGGVGGELARDVQAWCAANGSNKMLRIVLCATRASNDALLQHGWHTRQWTARKGSGSTGGRGQQRK